MPKVIGRVIMEVQDESRRKMEWEILECGCGACQPTEGYPPTCGSCGAQLPLRPVTAEEKR